MKADPKMVKLFYWFINERHNIFLRRFVKKEPAPWTEDKILQEYKLTNTYARLDRGNIYYTKYIKEPLEQNGAAPITLLFNTVIYRIFNRIETFEVIDLQTVRGYDRDVLYARLTRHREKGNKIFTDAFMVTGRSKIDQDKHDKLDNYLDIIGHFRDRILHHQYDDCEHVNIELLWQKLNDEKGIGKFLAYLIVSDLATSKLFPKLDINEWANTGPGAEKGLKYIFVNIKPYEYLDAMRWLNNNQRYYLDELGFQPWQGEYPNLYDTEFELCEFSKYVKTKQGTGRPRVRFVPTQKQLEV